MPKVRIIEISLALTSMLVALSCGPTSPTTPDVAPPLSPWDNIEPPRDNIDAAAVTPGNDDVLPSDASVQDAAPPDAHVGPDAYYDPLGMCKDSWLTPSPPVYPTCERTTCNEHCASLGKSCTWQCDLLFGSSFAGLALYRGTGDQCDPAFGCPVEWLHSVDCFWLPPETSPAGFNFIALDCCCL